MVSQDFEVAAGSIVGRDHLRPFGWRNNQDSFAIRVAEDAVVAVVADGCGSEAKSEVGAAIGANLVAEAVLEEFHSLVFGGGFPDLLFWVRQRVLKGIGLLAKAMNVGNFKQTIYDHFLFTVNGVLVTKWGTALFAVGDGVQFVNGERILLGPFENNTPPYLAYTTLGNPDDPDPLNDFKITRVLPTGEVQSILIGTDGAEALIAAEYLTVPGRLELIGSISQFWEEDCYFENSDMIRRRLALAQNEHLAVDWREKTVLRTSGRLSDDTTLIAIRRKPKR